MLGSVRVTRDDESREFGGRRVERPERSEGLGYGCVEDSSLVGPTGSGLGTRERQRGGRGLLRASNARTDGQQQLRPDNIRTHR